MLWNHVSTSKFFYFIYFLPEESMCHYGNKQHLLVKFSIPGLKSTSLLLPKPVLTCVFISWIWHHHPLSSPCPAKSVSTWLWYSLSSLHLTALLPDPPSALAWTISMTNQVCSAPFNPVFTSASKSDYSTRSTLWWFLSPLKIKSRTAYEVLHGPHHSISPASAHTIHPHAQGFSHSICLQSLYKLCSLLPQSFVPPCPTPFT